MEQTIPQFSNRMTDEEYLRMEEVAQTKHEFRDGQIIDMAGGTLDHAGIAANLIVALSIALKGKPCRAYGSDLRVRINRSGNYVYPDVSIVCGPVQFAHPNRKTTIINPQVVVEVTSESTENDDRGDKFNDYRRIESLQEYVLVSQDRARVETFYRQTDGIWAIGPSVIELNQSATLRSLSIEIALKDVYAGIELAPIQPRTPQE